MNVNDSMFFSTVERLVAIWHVPVLLGTIAVPTGLDTCYFKYGDTYSYMNLILIGTAITPGCLIVITGNSSLERIG